MKFLMILEECGTPFSLLEIQCYVSSSLQRLFCHRRPSKRKRITYIGIPPSKELICLLVFYLLTLHQWFYVILSKLTQIICIIQSDEFVAFLFRKTIHALKDFSMYISSFTQTSLCTSVRSLSSTHEAHTFTAIQHN